MLRQLIIPFGLLMSAATFVGCDGTSSKIKNVFGDDDRKWVTSRDFPYSVIGKLDTGCTGTLIGRKLMLTAAHCVFDSLTERPLDHFTRFSLSLRNGQAVADLTPVRAWIGSTLPEDFRGTDWAIVELAEPVGDYQGFMKVKATDFTKSLPSTVSLAGYSADVNAGLTASVHHDCSIRKSAENLLLHDCDSTIGIAGGPLFKVIDDEMNLVGISVSEFRSLNEGKLEVEQWSVESTNVGVSAESFANAVKILRNSVDLDKDAPVLKDAVLVDFKIASLMGGDIPEQAPGQMPDQTPDVKPQQTPSVAPQQAPQIQQTAVYSAQQMNSLQVLWSSINLIQDVNGVLIDDSSQLARQAIGSGHQQLNEAIQQFTNASIQNLNVWNMVVHYGVNGSLVAYDINLIYNSYVNLKDRQRQIQVLMLEMPESSRQNIQSHVNVLTDHVAYFEALIFVR